MSGKAGPKEVQRVSTIYFPDFLFKDRKLAA
jgi:hypothetical protein